MDKPEAVLGGRSVEYGKHATIKSDLDREVAALDKFEWNDKDKLTSASKFASHMTAIWKVHPFREGNTRTIGAFVQQFSKERGFELDRETLWERPSETRDMLAKATTGQPKELISTILTAHQIGKDRNHPELGRITSQTAHVLRLMGKPAIQFPKAGEQVQGQVLDVSYNKALVFDGRAVKAVDTANFSKPVAANARVKEIVTQALEPANQKAQPPKTQVHAQERDAGDSKSPATKADIRTPVIPPPKSKDDKDRSR